MDRRSIAVLSSGHALVDICQGSVPALIPFLIARRGYSYSEATALILVMTFSSSLLQPLFGLITDRRSISWLLPGGILVGGLGIAAVGAVSSFPLTLAAVAVAGIGVGAYHPEGARNANYVAGTKRRATAMSLYAVGGNAGFALGPVIVTALVLTLGLGGLVWFAVPMAIGALLLFLELPRIDALRLETIAASADRAGKSGKDRWLPFTGVATVAGFRSATYFGLQAFVPVFMITEMGTTDAVGNAALTVLLVAGAVGTLAGGHLADRVGTRPVLVVSLGVVVPLILALLEVTEPLAFPLLAAIGFFLVGTFSISVVLGQEYLPNRIGVASGVTLGAAIGFGGLVAWLLGLLADQTSLTTVMIVIAALPLPGFLISMLLPGENVLRQPLEEPA
ncbi:MAG: MFS transporter [Solirubrobacterales bacterium]|nr:MFS transporter [Solirubrobacterales bacterium]